MIGTRTLYYVTKEMSSKKMVTTRNKSLTPAVMRKKGHATIDVNENCATKLQHHM